MYKQVTGLSYEALLFNQKLTSIAAVKFYHYNASGFTIDRGVSLQSRQTQNNIGFSEALKFQFSEGFLTKASYEYATRLPDEYEVFGDFYLVQPNAKLVPETSQNVNLGVVWNRKKISFELNTFYRHVDDIIYLRTAQNFAQYQNLLKADIKGIESEISLKPITNLTFTLNATYQDLRSRTAVENSGTLDERYNGARIPNIPYLFYNAEVRYTKNDFLKNGNALQLWWNANYIHQFFLYWEIDGRKESKYVIPSQFLQNSGVSYSFLESRLTISSEVYNILNVKAYDNFRVQRPGRSFSIKARYYISK